MQAVNAVAEFLSGANVSRFLSAPSVLPFIASSVASDYLRKMNPMEREKACRWIEDHHPGLARIISRDHPDYWD